MPIPGINHKFDSREQGFTLHVIEMTVGGTGAVASVDGKGFAASGVASGELGGIVRDGVGEYTITLPGYGGVQRIVPHYPLIFDGVVGDGKNALMTNRSAGNREFSWSFVDNATDAAEELSSGSVVIFQVLVKQSSVS